MFDDRMVMVETYSAELTVTQPQSLPCTPRRSLCSIVPPYTEAPPATSSPRPWPTSAETKPVDLPFTDLDNPEE
jgi:hypothetical protein